jgi:hypothetical protein
MIKFDRKSWHYRLASKYVPGNYSYMMGEPNNICQYVSDVIKGLGFAAILSGVSGLAILCAFVMPIMSFCFGFGLLPDKGDFWALGFYPFWMSAIILSLTFGITYLIHKIQTRSKIEKEPGFLRVAYKSYKDKFCVLVKFE